MTIYYLDYKHNIAGYIMCYIYFIIGNKLPINIMYIFLYVMYRCFWKFMEISYVDIYPFMKLLDSVCPDVQN